MQVAVLAGGRSSEHDISIASACAILSALEDVGHGVEPIVIGRDGIWRQRDPRDNDSDKGRPVALVPGGARAAMLSAGEDEDGISQIDVVFPVLHGPYGEDGTVQGVLECADIPYVGAGVLASAVCMDKVAFKTILAEAGISQVRYAQVREEEWKAGPDAIRGEMEALGLPVFVKPARLGSSVGISKADSREELGRALSAAFAHDPKAIVEENAAGREIECSVIGNRELTTSEPGEIVAHRDWYDYESKYSEDGMDLVVPAAVKSRTRRHIQQLAAEVYRLVGCEGLARVDFFLTDDEDVLVNELNTIPGFTTTSVFSRLFEESGIPYKKLLDRLIELALERYETQKRFRF